MTTPGDRLRQAREARGFRTAKDAALAMDVPVATYTQHENPKRLLPEKKAQAYADYFKTTPEWLLYGISPLQERALEAVPIIGQTGVAPQGLPGDEKPSAFVKLPPRPRRGMRVVVVSETDPLSASFKGWYVYFGPERPPSAKALSDNLCVICRESGALQLGRLIPSATPDRFHLVSASSTPILDQVVRWASAVIYMAPP
jgi:hypothetical protein